MQLKKRSLSNAIETQKQMQAQPWAESNNSKTTYLQTVGDDIRKSSQNTRFSNIFNGLVGYKGKSRAGT